MSILIKGMDMPKEGEHIVAIIKSNGKCSCWKQDTEYGICESMQTVEAIQIPTPHGRLIDGDKIDYDEFWHREGQGFTITVCQKAQQIIEEQPTILEAEE